MKLVLVLVGVAVLSVIAGLVACLLTRHWDYIRRLLFSSLVSALVVTPAWAGGNDSAGSVPLIFVLLPNGATGFSTAILSLPFTWLASVLMFLLVGKISGVK